MNDETYTFPPENLVPILSAFFKEFKSNPLHYIPMDEAVSLFHEDHKVNEFGEFEILESDLKKFIDKINGILADRVMFDMDKKGHARLAHDGNQFFLIPNKAP